MKIKLSCRDDLLSPLSIKDKFTLARKLGFEAIELHGSNVWGREKEILAAYRDGVIFSNIAAGYWGSLADSRPSEGEKAYNSACYLLRFAAEIGARGLVVIPFWGWPFSPLGPLAEVSLPEEKMIGYLRGLAELAEKLKVKVFLEPVNRYESPVFNRLEEMSTLISRIDRPALKILADFFHMNIEEESIAESIRRSGSLIGLVHLADSNRLAPGEGHTDFRKPLESLEQAGFAGYLSFECRGKIDASMLAKGAKYIKGLR